MKWAKRYVKVTLMVFQKNVGTNEPFWSGQMKLIIMLLFDF